MYVYPPSFASETKIGGAVAGATLPGVGSPRPDSRRLRSPIGGGAPAYSDIGEPIPGGGLSTPTFEYAMPEVEPLTPAQMYFPDTEAAANMPPWWIPFVFGGKDGNQWRPPLPPFDGGIMPPLNGQNIFNMKGELPLGAIIAWHDADNIPFGWVMCDYEHHEVPPNGIATVGHTINGIYVPNLEGRFLAMACDDVDHLADWQTNDTKETFDVGDVGGYRIHGNDGANDVNNHADHDIEHTHEGVTDYESSHTHASANIVDVDNNDDGARRSVWDGNASATAAGQQHLHSFTTALGGSDSVSHSEADNRPPVYYLLFIIRIR